MVTLCEAVVASSVLEAAAYEVMTALCPASFATSFLTTANGKLAGYLYALTVAYWLENTPQGKIGYLYALINNTNLIIKFLNLWYLMDAKINSLSVELMK